MILDSFRPFSVTLDKFAQDRQNDGELYIIQKKDKYYTKITADLQNHLRQHSNPPLLYTEKFPDKHQNYLVEMLES